MIDPKPLFPGARVALVAPASAVPEEKLPGALDLVRRLGMEPVLYPSCYFANRDGYLAATDAQRAEDVNRAFADKTIDGVWCIRGGYGGQPKDVVLCACSNKQLYEIEHAVQAIDPGCFIIMLQSNEVHGEGFRQLELGKNENKSE